LDLIGLELSLTALSPAAAWYLPIVCFSISRSQRAKSKNDRNEAYRAHLDTSLPAAARYLLFLYFIFALYERKNEVQKEEEYRYESQSRLPLAPVCDPAKAATASSC